MKLYLEEAIQRKIAQIIDEHECKNQVYEKFERHFKEFMKYIPDGEIEKYLELEDMFHIRMFDLIEFIYRAVVNGTLDELVDRTNEKASHLSLTRLSS